VKQLRGQYEKVQIYHFHHDEHVDLGLTSIIPKFAIPIFSWNEIETKVGGVPGVDINILQSNTEYDDGISPCDRHIQTFWYECIKLKLALMIHREILHSFDDTEKSAFLRFVWARARLPNSSNLSQKFKIQVRVFRTSWPHNLS